MADDRLDLVWQEAVRGLESQGRMIDEARARAGTLATAGSIVATFLGSQALTDQHKSAWGPIGTAGFVVLIAAVIYVLFPRSFTFVLSPRKVIGSHIDTEEGNDLDQMHWALSEELEGYLDDNEVGRGRMSVALALACLALGVETFAWLIEIRG